jgi:putative zinc finger/helix-turn-helix YgiT family protein
MMSDKLPPPVERDRPYPWRCVECKADEVYPQATDYTITVKHDGRPYSIHIPDLAIPTCRNCGDQLFTAESDDRIIAALRAQIGLLTPQEILAQRGELELTQQEMAEQIGVAKETISRWESGGMIQSRAMDNLMRLFFGSEEVRRMLRERFAKPSVAGSNRVFKRVPQKRATLYASLQVEAYVTVGSKN